MTQIKFKKVGIKVMTLGFCALTLLLPAVVMAKHVDRQAAYGPESKRFGAGIYVGEPTGLTIKGYLSERAAIQGLAAWSLRNDALTLIADLDYEMFDISMDAHSFTLPFYVGVGGKVQLNSGNNDNSEFGVRVPIGVAMQWNTAPVEVFVEVVPGLVLIQDTDFDLMGGLGVRFYF